MKTIIFFLALINSNFPGVELDRQQTYCLAHTVYHEARGELISGQVAVAYVVLNRVHSVKHPNTICEVAYERKQFTNIKLTKPITKSKAWETAVEIAAYAQVGLVDDNTDGATIYHNPIKSPNPRWDFSKLSLVGNLANHRFYKEI